MTLLDNEKFILDEKDFDVSEIGLNFVQEGLENLEEEVKKSQVAEATKFTYELPMIQSKEIQNIEYNLKEIVKEKVVNI